MGAGSVAFVKRAFGDLKRRCSETRYHSSAELADATESVLVWITKKYGVDRMRELGIEGMDGRMSRAKRRGPDLPMPEVALLVAAVDASGEKTLCTIGVDAVALIEDTYTAIGSGSAYAEYVLGRLYASDLNVEQGIDCAAYVIEEVKKVDPSCGGPTQVAVVTKDQAHIKSVDETRELVGRLEIRDVLLGKLWRSLVLGKKQPSDVSAFLES